MEPKDFEGKWVGNKPENATHYWYMIKIVKVSEDDFEIDRIHITSTSVNITTKNLWHEGTFTRLKVTTESTRDLQYKAIEGIFK